MREERQEEEWRDKCSPSAKTHYIIKYIINSGSDRFQMLINRSAFPSYLC